MVRALGPRARVRTRVVRGERVHELLIYRERAGSPRAIRFPTRAEAERQARRREAHLRPDEIGAFLRAASGRSTPSHVATLHQPRETHQRWRYLDRAVAGRASVRAVR